MNTKKKLTSLKFAYGAVRFMHGSVTGNPEFDHTVNPAICKCEHGDALRGLGDLIDAHRELLRQAKKEKLNGR